MTYKEFHENAARALVSMGFKETTTPDLRTFVKDGVVKKIGVVKGRYLGRYQGTMDTQPVYLDAKHPRATAFVLTV